MLDTETRNRVGSYAPPLPGRTQSVRWTTPAVSENCWSSQTIVG